MKHHGEDTVQIQIPGPWVYRSKRESEWKRHKTFSSPEEPKPRMFLMITVSDATKNCSLHSPRDSKTCILSHVSDKNSRWLLRVYAPFKVPVPENFIFPDTRRCCIYMIASAGPFNSLSRCSVEDAENQIKGTVEYI